MLRKTTFIQLITLTLAILTSLNSPAALSERTVKGVSLFKKIKSQGVPEGPLKRVFEFIDNTSHKKIDVRADSETRTLSISNTKYLTIIDYTLPSSKRRLYFIDLIDGSVDKYYVAHGLNSGGDLATAFSNIVDSNQSSLGIYLTGSPYIGSHGISLRLYGLEKSNSRAWDRSIVMHGADYISLDFLEENNRMGRSLGCPAVSNAIAEIIIPRIKEGSILYMHHDVLMKEALKNPSKQSLKKLANQSSPKPVEKPTTPTTHTPATPPKPKPSIDSLLDSWEAQAPKDADDDDGLPPIPDDNPPPAKAELNQ